MVMYKDLVTDFVHRTKANLEFINQHDADDEKAPYKTTHLINSCLGMIVFTNERYTLPNITLKEFCPTFRFTQIVDKCHSTDNIKNFIRCTRNAIAHCNITPIGKDTIERLELKTLNQRSIIKWHVIIDITELRKLALAVGDYVASNK